MDAFVLMNELAPRVRAHQGKVAALVKCLNEVVAALALQVAPDIAKVLERAGETVRDLATCSAAEIQLSAGVSEKRFADIEEQLNGLRVKLCLPAVAPLADSAKASEQANERAGAVDLVFETNKEGKRTTLGEEDLFAASLNGEPVAVKVYEHEKTREHHDVFCRRIEELRKRRHPGIVEVKGATFPNLADCSDDTAYSVTTARHRCTVHDAILTARLTSSAVFPNGIVDKLRIVSVLAHGLQAAHNAGVVFGALTMRDAVIMPDGRAAWMPMAGLHSLNATSTAADDILTFGRISRELFVGEIVTHSDSS